MSDGERVDQQGPAGVEGPRCPRCAARSRRLFAASDRNRAITDGRFDYRRCTDCGVVWLSNPPDDLDSYYPAGYHGLFDSVALAEAAAHESDRVALLERHVTAGQIVEIGPSHGAFSLAAKNAGYDVIGLEMDARCCEHLERAMGIRAINTNSPAVVLPTLAPSRAVVMFHVIEHVPNPWDLLRAIAHHLEPGGVLVLATPNPASLQFRLLGTRWVHLDAPRHVTLIPLDSLRDEARALGLSLVEVTTTDRTGLECNRLGWERSLIRPPALRPDPRFAYTVGRSLTAVARPLERQGLRGSTYTAVFRKPR